jgi:hypothetical protein
MVIKLIDRAVMPQVDLADYPALFDFATQRGYWPHEVQLHWSACYAHQSVDDFDPERMKPDVLTKPILISEHHVILDGHHRWAAHRLTDSRLTAYRFPLPFQRAIGLLFDYPGTYRITERRGD